MFGEKKIAIKVPHIVNYLKQPVLITSKLQLSQGLKDESRV